MLCQSCHKKQATTHIKTIVNGELTQYALCPECAQKLGYGSLFGGFGEGLSSFLGSFFGTPQSAAAERLPEETCCRAAARAFRISCEPAASAAPNAMRPFTTGWRPPFSASTATPPTPARCRRAPLPERRLQNDLEKARRELKEAVEEQRFEEAARLRDRIREMEGEVKSRCLNGMKRPGKRATSSSARASALPAI